MNIDLTNMKTCSKCKCSKSLNNFGKIGKYRNSWCNSCRAKLESKRRRKKGIKKKKTSYMTHSKKLCLHCNKLKKFELFAKSIRGLGGLASYCKECFLKRYPRDKQKAAISTAKYRKSNRERYLAKHRLHQFKRKTAITVTDDGSVTDEFLKELYATKICYICQKNIPKKNRTADHIISLKRGGKHSASNLKMACFTCNSSKGAK